MSLLTPLYVLGLLAVSLPVVFHLIRRMPKGEFQFSSLMFLSPSPPRLTRRSRLEHLLLLLLRGLALGLLAFAFARPFLRQSTAADVSDGEGRRVAIVVDTSASMRRGDLWQQAAAQVDAALAEGGPLDQMALFVCDDTLRPVIGFEEMAEVPPAQRRGTIRARLAAMSPTWAGTHLGRTLADAVEFVNNVPDEKDRESRTRRRIVLVTDLQTGSRMDALADYPWPEDVELELRAVKPAQTTNAGLHRLSDRLPAEPDGKSRELRFRVSNDAASAVDQFRLSWLGGDNRPLGKPIAAYVPAGESRVVRVPRPPAAAAAQRLELSGDGCEFDNTLYLATRPQAETTVAYLGTDAADDPGQLRYYLDRALAAGLTESIELLAPAADEKLKLDTPATTPLAVVTTEPTEEQTRQLRQHAKAGGTVLFVLNEAKPSTALNKLLDAEPLDIEEADVDKYAMLGQIAFDHPLFASMAGPHFNDFTQIHFWKYRRLKRAQLGDATVVASFENGDPAIIERRLGKGKVIVFTSGWQPSDSQLARSWKFVLLVSALVEGRGGGKSDRVYFVVNEPVPLGDEAELAGERQIVKPDGEKALLAADARVFDGADQPGVYMIEPRSRVSPKLGNGSLGETALRENFAVNLDPAESATSPLAVETLEQLGCRLVSDTAASENDVRQRQLRDVQLESRQKLWQWLIVAALGVLVTETWLAGRVTKTSLAKPVSA